MKKPAISITKVKKIKNDDLADKAKEASDAILGNPIMFEPPYPTTALIITTLITTFISTKAAHKLGGRLAKPAFDNARKGLVDELVLFVSYVNNIAKGNLDILHASTLPTNEDEKDFAALIAGGATAQNVWEKKGMSGQIITGCDNFGENVEYVTLICEGGILPEGATVDANGQVTFPTGFAGNIYTSIFLTRKKTFNNLKPGVFYYIYYVLVYKGTVGRLSAPLKAVCN